MTVGVNYLVTVAFDATAAAARFYYPSPAMY